MKRLTLFLLFLSLLTVLLSSQVIGATYADIELRLTSEGTVEIEGLTNYEGFIEYENEDYLTYNGKYWTLNITTQEEFSDVIYKIILPESVTVNYLRVPNLLTIDNKNSRMMVVGTAHDEKLNVILQYTTESKKSSMWWFILMIVAFFIALFVWRFIMMPVDKTLLKHKGLTERQQKIINIVLENQNGITQGEIEKRTKLPKSSLSRNIDSLARKELIIKEQSGMSNKIFLKK